MSDDVQHPNLVELAERVKPVIARQSGPITDQEMADVGTAYVYKLVTPEQLLAVYKLGGAIELAMALMRDSDMGQS